MKKNLNVIQINGLRGILLAIGVVSCLAAGFIVFPGFVMELIWNAVAGYTGALPQIAMYQGVLLWSIIVISYIAFKKKMMFIEFKSANDLSRDEMEEVMQRIRLQNQADIIARAMEKARQDIENKTVITTQETTADETEKNRVDI